jgi:stage V sporulation protein R
MRVNGGFPYIVVEDGDYSRTGELYLKHGYEGMELDPHYLENVLPYIYQLWGRAVFLETYVEEKPTLYSYDGKKVSRSTL